MRVSVIGGGFVGTTVATSLAVVGNDVNLIEKDEGRIDALRKGRPLFYEAGVQDLLQRVIGRSLFISSKLEHVKNSDIVFVAVGTPEGDRGRADLKYVEAVIDELASMKWENKDPIIALKSTVPPGTTRSMMQRFLEAKPKSLASFAMIPEFLAEGTALNDFQYPDRIVVGVENPNELGPQQSTFKRLFNPFLRSGNPLLFMSWESAELTKYASNAQLAARVSLMNEIADIAEATGANVDDVRIAVGYDSRIGRKFLYPGLGFGGSCFPKDVAALRELADSKGVKAPVLSGILDTNVERARTYVKKVPMSAEKIAIWGMAFKPRTSDIRESPALRFVNFLINRGDPGATPDLMGRGTPPEVWAHDPVVKEVDAPIRLGDQYEILDGADALVICTDWDHYKNPDFDEIRSRMRKPLIVDGRNLYDRESHDLKGIQYVCIGR